MTFKSLSRHGAVGRAGRGAVAACVLMLGLLTPSVAEAQEFGVRGWALRGGLTVNPDQGHVGFHVDLGDLTSRLGFRPSFEVGFGHETITYSLNLDVMYRFGQEAVRPYVGGGLGITRYDDRINFFPRQGSDTEAGFVFLAGFEFSDGRYFLEGRLGTAGLPEVRVSAGIVF